MNITINIKGKGNAINIDGLDSLKDNDSQGKRDLVEFIFPNFDKLKSKLDAKKVEDSKDNDSEDELNILELSNEVPGVASEEKPTKSGRLIGGRPNDRARN